MNMNKIDKNNEFIIKAKSIHGDRYDYSLVNFINNKTKVKIICPNHGEFYKRADHHLNYSGCTKCLHEKFSKEYKSSTNEFINKAKIIHGDKYDYSFVEYKSAINKVKIVCREHGEFEQRPSDHLSRSGCRNCFLDRNKLRVDEFIKKAKSIHGEKYDYSLSKYKSTISKLKIICNKHGVFEKSPYHHLRGQGCNICSNENAHYNQVDTIDDFLIKARSIHGDRYDYSLVKYFNCKTKIDIICKKHGVFKQMPFKHTSRKNGCPSCKASKGENIVAKFLDNSKIEYIRQMEFEGCKYKRNLKFDFYIPSKNTCVEFNGQQHFIKYNFEKNYDKLKIRIIRDNIKEKYCKLNNINLLKINYNDNIIEKLKIII